MLLLQVIVELRVVFLKIGEIDTLKEQYSADTFMQAKWREPALDGKSIEVSCRRPTTSPVGNCGHYWLPMTLSMTAVFATFRKDCF